MSIEIRVFNLPGGNQGDRSEDNLVEGILARHPRSIRGMRRHAGRKTWTTAGSEAPRDLGSVAGVETHVVDVLETATRSGALLVLDLYGGRRYVVPDHHWPVLQIVDA